MTDINTPPDNQTQTETNLSQTPPFSWKTPDNYTPKHDYYADLVMSYSALTDIINPKEIQCDFGDVRALDSCLLEQAILLNEITQKMLNDIYYSDGSVSEKRLFNALKAQQAFRESYRNANLAMTHRYIASTKPL